MSEVNSGIEQQQPSEDKLENDQQSSTTNQKQYIMFDPIPDVKLSIESPDVQIDKEVFEKEIPNMAAVVLGISKKSNEFPLGDTSNLIFVAETQPLELYVQKIPQAKVANEDFVAALKAQKDNEHLIYYNNEKVQILAHASINTEGNVSLRFVFLGDKNTGTIYKC